MRARGAVTATTTMVVLGLTLVLGACSSPGGGADGAKPESKPDSSASSSPASAPAATDSPGPSSAAPSASSAPSAAPSPSASEEPARADDSRAARPGLGKEGDTDEPRRAPQGGPGSKASPKQYEPVTKSE
ncbi:hypothetical protein ABZ990_11590 [Streptomyces sp. NPDC046203]|uniref:hypothetical protein n=1 Tax=Streptomyces sp. NPDC046203 TaxID=3154602 RepID=UPI0034098F6F